jgi:hypothetical protein
MSGFRKDPDTAVDGLIALSSIPSTPQAVKARVKRSAMSAQFPLVLTALESSLRWDLDASLAACRIQVSAIIAAQLADPDALDRYRDRIAFYPVPDVSHYLLLEAPRRPPTPCPRYSRIDRRPPPGDTALTQYRVWPMPPERGTGKG